MGGHGGGGEGEGGLGANSHGVGFPPPDNFSHRGCFWMPFYSVLIPF